jgi:hypothetical protein
MDIKSTIRKKPLDKLKIIYDNDCAILDFLADLWTRKSVRDLQNFIDDSKGLAGCLLINCELDNIMVLILYKSPFDFNGGDNNLIMYADNDLQSLIKYFKNQLAYTPPEAVRIYCALNDITRLLYWEWAQQEDMNTQTSFLG